MEDRYLTIHELIKYSRLSERTLRDLIGQEEIKHFRMKSKGKILVKRSWFDEYVEKSIDRQSQNPKIKRMADTLMEEIS